MRLQRKEFVSRLFLPLSLLLYRSPLTADELHTAPSMHVKVPMIDTRRIATAPGLVFDASIGGSDTAPLVLMLHGFGVSRYLWNAQVRALAEAGFFAAAPNQRGYAVEARPDPFFAKVAPLSA